MSAISSTRQGLHISTREGGWASLHMALTTGAFFTGYALLLGANDLELALLASLPVLTQLFQVPGAYLVERTGLRKHINGWGAFLGRLAWLPMALIPFVQGAGIRTFLVLYLVSNILLNLASPAWVAWMTDLVPQSIRGRYFGYRNRVVGVVTMVASLGAGWALDGARAAGHETGGYLGLQLLAVLAAAMAFRLILRQPEPGYAPEPLPPLRTYLLRPLGNPAYRRVLAFYLYWLFAVGLSAPFFSAHLLKSMGWEFKKVTLTAVVSSGMAILFHPFWGRIVDRHGNRPVLGVCALGILHLPLYYAFSPHDGHWPIFLNALLAGIFWSGFNLAMFNLVMLTAPGQGRPGYVAAYAALSGVVNFAASIVGGMIAFRFADFHVTFWGLSMVNYQLIFLLGSLLRLPGLLLLRRIHEPRAKPTSVLVRQAFIEIDRRIGFGRQVLMLPAYLRDLRGGRPDR